MGQIPNKTYTAPDGSVYRVEADGSVTKIKGGSIQSNEPPSKYKITSDGKIYSVEDDGSVTYLGNADERNQSYTSYQYTQPEPKKKSYAWVWIILFLVIATAIAIGGAFYYGQRSNDPPKKSYKDEEEIVEPQNEVSSSEALTEGSMASEGDTELNHIFYPGDIQGEFYGSIDDLGTIHGNWSCGSQMGGGWYCFDSLGDESGRSLDYTNDNPLVWYERIDYGCEYEDTGVWHFDYFDGTQDCIATGTYVRSSDNRQFRFRLYKIKK